MISNRMHHSQFSTFASSKCYEFMKKTSVSKEPLEFYRKIKISNTKIFVHTIFTRNIFFPTVAATSATQMITQSVHRDISHTDHFEARYQISDSSATKSKSAATRCIIQSSCCRYLKFWKSPTPEVLHLQDSK